MRPANETNRYVRLLEAVFLRNHTPGEATATFKRSDIAEEASRLGVDLPKNLGDLIYTFRYRTEIPQSMRDAAPAGLVWAIFPLKARPAAYRFAAVPFNEIVPTRGMTVVKIPDATPGLIQKYALTDEQALLAKVRYNRLIDIYTGVTTYALQSHLRTSIDEGQVETDEIYVGVDKFGAHHVFPVQAKGGTDIMSIVQIWQDYRVCQKKLPRLIARPIAVQFLASDVIAMFSFDWDGQDGITLRPGGERHYQLVPPGDLTPAELHRYGALAEQSGL